MNIFQLYGCENKEELYEKIKSNDSNVHSLQEFIDFAKGSIELSDSSINSPEKFALYYSGIGDSVSGTNKVMCLFVDTKSKPVHHTNIDIYNKGDLQSKLKEGLSSGASSVFIARDENMDYATKIKISKFFNDVGVSVIDEFHTNKEGKTLYSSKQDGYIDIPIDSLKMEKENSLSQYQGYNDFASHYTQEETVGLNMIADNHLILENLKIGYQHELQEYLGVITYDDEYNVTTIQEVALGGVSAAVVDPRVLMEKVLQEDEVKGFALFHNHPSGNVDPSPEDDGVTRRIDNICEHLEVEFLDHYIVGKENIYSYDKDSQVFESTNLEYRNSIRGVQYQQNFDLDM